MRSFKYSLLLVTLMMVSLFSFDDLDFDGVSDDKDQCPQSLFSDLVDKNGCKVSSIAKAQHSFDIYTSIATSKRSDFNYISSSIGLAYFYNKFSLSFSNFYYNYELLDYDASLEGQGDYSIGLSYKVKLSNDISLSLKSGALIPSYDEERKKTDIFITLSSSYQINNKLNVFGGWTYNFINDLDSENNKYDNYRSFNVGSKYKVTSNAYVSLYYSQSGSSFGDDENKNLYLSTSYYFDNGVYIVIDIGQELNDDPAISHSFKVGYFL